MELFSKAARAKMDAFASAAKPHILNQKFPQEHQSWLRFANASNGAGGGAFYIALLIDQAPSVNSLINKFHN